MASDLTLTLSTVIKKGTPVPSRVLSPSKLRTAKLPFSEDLARDVESLSSDLNRLHTTIANSTPAVSIPPASAGSPGLVKPDGTTITIDANGVIHAVGGVELATNNVDNGSQHKLNLIAGTNITLVDDGAGNVTVSSSATAANLIEVNGAPVGAAGLAANGLVIGFLIGAGGTGTNVGPMLPAPHLGALTTCVVTVKKSDPSIGLQFTIKRNGTAVFTTAPTVAAGTATGSVLFFTGLTSSPLNVAQSDVFSIDILAGSNTWQFTAQLE